MRRSLALLVTLSGCGGHFAPPGTATEPSLPATAGPTLALQLPKDLRSARADVRDPKNKLSGSCESLASCASITNWFTTQGPYSLELDYVAADGVREKWTQEFSAGFGESSVTLFSMPDEDGVIEAMYPHNTGAPVEGVSLRLTKREPVTALSELALVNGSKAPIFVASQDGIAWARLSGVNGTPDPPRLFVCGTGMKLAELAPGQSMPLGEAAFLGRGRAIPRGRYSVSVFYGVDLHQELMSLGGSRAAQLELDFDGPEPEPPTAQRARPQAFTPKDPGRPAVTFSPSRTEGAERVAEAPKLELDQPVEGTLTAKSPRRYFRVDLPGSVKAGAVRIYARCETAGCEQSAYAVLTDEPDSVSDARRLRSSGGWTRLTDDVPLSDEKPRFLVVGCLDDCPTATSFFGIVTNGRR